jgi:hypothetical protein
MKMEQIECSETSAYKIQTPGNHAEENIQIPLLVCIIMGVSHCAVPNQRELPASEKNKEG